MIQPQFIKTPEGGELVVLERADYEALLEAAREAEEDADDVAAYDAAKSAPASFQRLLPPDVSANVLKGDSLLKAWRKHARLTQAILAQRANIGQGYLSQIEAREKSASPAVLFALAKALREEGVEVDPDWLVGMEN